MQFLDSAYPSRLVDLSFELSEGADDFADMYLSLVRILKVSSDVTKVT